MCIWLVLDIKTTLKKTICFASSNCQPETGFEEIQVELFNKSSEKNLFSKDLVWNTEFRNVLKNYFKNIEEKNWSVLISSWLIFWYKYKHFLKLISLLVTFLEYWNSKSKNSCGHRF